MDNAVIIGIVIVGVVVAAIAAYTLLGDVFNPEEFCASSGMVFDRVTGICIPAGGLGESCTAFFTGGLCQYGLSCQWDINPLVGFRSCQGTLTYGGA